MYRIISFKWEKRIKVLNSEYVIAYNIKIIKLAKVF